MGVTFDNETALTVREPLNLKELGSYSKLSLFFKTDQRNGFLAYIGPDLESGGLNKARNFDL